MKLYILCNITSQNLKYSSTLLVHVLAGNVNIATGMKFEFIVKPDLNGNLQFTITCISMDGPATHVNWTRDSEAVLGGMTVLDNPVTAQYTHTLTVTERLGGQYQCTVFNSKPSSSTAQLTVEGIEIMRSNG